MNHKTPDSRNDDQEVRPNKLTSNEEETPPITNKSQIGEATNKICTKDAENQVKITLF